MKAILQAFVVALTAVALIASAQDAKPASPKPLSFDEVAKIIDNPGKTFFLDVREPNEIVEFGTVKGALNIPLKQLESRLSEVPKDRPVLTMCQRGVRAGLAAALLESKGYKVVGAAGMKEFHEKSKERLVYPKPAAK